MDILEKLYLVADEHLAAKKMDWAGFMAAFRTAMEAEAALYHVAFKADHKTIKTFSIVATSKPEVTDIYREKEIWRHNIIAETDMAPLEPQRRTDVFSDEEFGRYGPISDFFLGQGLYYFVIVPAVLKDGSAIALIVWRGKDQTDFSDAEKQRLALFMRHLLALVGQDAFMMNGPDENVVDFGARWNLTEVETEVLSALMNGLSVKEIAAQTGRTYGTVRWHVQNMLEKCQVNSQRDLMREFYGLIQR
jgi:DNA-binding CsgD family transcriptional regulator